MSETYVYFWIDGNDFDPVLFNESLISELQGEICIRKEVPANDLVKSRPKSFWKSKTVIVNEGFPEEKLIELLKLYEKNMAAILKQNEICIMAELVAKYVNNTEVGGYYFSPEAISFMSKLKIGLDIDVYVDDDCR